MCISALNYNVLVTVCVENNGSQASVPCRGLLLANTHHCDWI